MSDTLHNGQPPHPADPNSTDFHLDATIGKSVWWGTPTARTINLTEFGAGARTLDSHYPDMTLNLRAPAPDTQQQGSAEKLPAKGPPGRYLVMGEIARGGMGVVLEGWDVQLAREIAIKVLLQEHKEKPDVYSRFLEEARIASRLQHPGIAPIHELGLSPDNRPFFVMRMVHGQTLKQILSRREDASEDLPRLLDVFLKVCQAVGYAHSQGVIHRDLKPENIMVGSFGVVNVMDWGLAKVLGEPDLSDALAAAEMAAELSNRRGRRCPATSDQDLPGTRVGTVFGTPAYLPPEQARGEIDLVDKRADVFGLGSILCEILTGHPPYTGVTGREIYQKAVEADITSAIASLNASTASLDLITLAKWCLSPGLLDRPADACDVAEVMMAHLQSNQHRAEQDLVRFFDLTMDLFCIASTEGYFRRVNENFSRILGYTAEELTSRPFIDFVHPDDRERTEEVLVGLSRGEQCNQFLNRYRHVRGHYLWFEWNAQVIPEERAIYAVARELTQRINRAESHQVSSQSQINSAKNSDG
jgi:PAS domain S-box-containing protein